jgi:acyl-[acyl-carrier-protein]-phospholipid O-acyltransferase/long-chain-fatty-acid--[acyl-carrier-protein] ligase
MTAALAAALRTRATIAPQAREMLVKGGTILTSNHVSLLDGVLLALLSPAPLAVGVDSDWSVKSPWAARGMATLCWLGYGWVVPLDSGTPQGLRKLARHLREGRSVLLFP